VTENGQTISMYKQKKNVKENNYKYTPDIIIILTASIKKNKKTTNAHIFFVIDWSLATITE